MIAVPFVYFTLLTLFLWRRRGIDPSTYIAFLFALTTFFSLVIYADPYMRFGFGKQLQEVTLVPTFLFCFLHTLFILPVYLYNFKKIRYIQFSDFTFIKWMTYIYFACFLIYVIFYHKDIIFVATAGEEIANMRNSLYRGESIQVISRYPAIVEKMFLPFKVLANFSYIMIFLYVFMLTFTKMSKKMHIMMICGSLTTVLVGIMGVDRSKTFYWVILAGLALVMFWRFMHKDTKRYIAKIGTVILALLMTYFITVSISRFGQNDDRDALESSLTSYAGQSFINFCYFFNQYESPDGVTLKHLFPATHHYVFDSYDGAVSYQQMNSLKTGIECGVFYTQLGTFIISAGAVGPFIITIVYLLLAYAFMKRRGESTTFKGLTISFLLLVIPSTGIILYFYTSYYTTITLMVCVVLLTMLSYKRGNTLTAGNLLTIK